MPSFGDGWLRLLLTALLLLPLTIACQTAQPADEALYVAAAASLAQVLPEVGAAFQAETGIHTVFVFGSSGSLAEQIANGAPYDVFLSADEEHVDALIARGALDPASRRVYAEGHLVLVVSEAAADIVRQLDNLARPGVTRVAIANPTHAPYGRAAVEALRRSGLWPAVEPKVVMAENVRQALQFVQTGNATAGLVAASLLPAPGVEVRPVPEGLYTPVRHAAAIVRHTQRRSQAEAFLAFLLSERGQALLRGHGFASPTTSR